MNRKLRASLAEGRSNLMFPQGAESASNVVVIGIATPAENTREDWRASHPGLLQFMEAALDALRR